MHIQASAFPLIKPAHLLESSITAEGGLCVHANSTWARIPPEWSNSILIYSNLNLSKRADARVTSAQLVGGGASYHSLKYSIQAFLTRMTCGMKDGPVHFASSFSPLISCVWVLSQKAIFRLCPFFHICTNTLAFERAPWVAAQPKSGPEEQLERYRLMAQETAEASGMNK